jgi:hypothetical protein
MSKDKKVNFTFTQLGFQKFSVKPRLNAEILEQLKSSRRRLTIKVNNELWREIK